jgi:hypothetical protein
MSGPVYFAVSTAAEFDAAVAAISLGGTAAAVNTVYSIIIENDLVLAAPPPVIDLAAGSSLTITGDNVNNYANQGHIGSNGIASGLTVVAGVVTLDNLDLDGFSASGGGAALTVESGAAVVTTATNFLGNIATNGAAGGAAILVQQGGTLSLGTSTVEAGIGNSIFIQGGAIDIANGTTITGVITDPEAAGFGTAAGAVDITGLATLTGANLYTGGTEIGVNGVQGALVLQAPGAAGSGTIAFGGVPGSELIIGSGDVPANVIGGFAVGDTIDLQNVGLEAHATIVPGNSLMLTGGTVPVTLKLDPALNYAIDTLLLQSDGAGGTQIALAQTSFTIASEADLNAVLTQIDLGGASSAPGLLYSLTFAAGFTLGSELYAINLAAGDTLTINGNGQTMDGGGVQRGFFVYAGDVTIENLTIRDAVAIGGAGGSGAVAGGGGAGLGGGLFIAAGATVALDAVTFSSDGAIGGAGGALVGYGYGGGGGLGGAGGAGEAGTPDAGGGGGVGTSAIGGSSASSTGVSGGPGILLGAGPGGPGQGSGAGAGGADGGGGGGGGEFSGSGRDPRSTPGPSGAGGDSSNGNFGGGGGTGTAAGFGGGNGGWGGGGVESGGQGIGGDIFVQSGGMLMITAGTLAGGSVQNGAASNGTPGSTGLASGIFAQGGGTLDFAPGAGQTLTVTDVIGDSTGVGMAPSGAEALLLNGLGTVELDAQNSFTGVTTIDSGTLILNNPSSAGSGKIEFAYGAIALLQAGSGDVPGNVISGFLPGVTIDLQGIGLATAANLLPGDTLAVTGGSIPVLLTLDTAQLFTGESFFTQSDGNGGTLVKAQTIQNDHPPSIAGAPATVSGNDHTAFAPLAGVIISDLDTGQIDTATLTLSSLANGTLSNLASGSFNAATGVYTVAGSAAAVSAAVEGLVFTPVDHEVAPGATVATGFSLTVTDGLMDAAVSDNIVVTALNDPPVITGGGTWLDGYFTVPIALFGGVAIIDPDFAAVETLTITFGDEAGQNPTDFNGTLAGTGVTKTGIGTYVITGTPSQVTAELDASEFTPLPLTTPGFVITTVALSVDDGIAPPVVTGWTALSAGLPIFTGTQGGQTVPVNATIDPFASVSVTDSPGLNIEGFSITLENASGAATDANGTLSGAGWTHVGTGIYALTIQNTTTGDATSLVTAELDALVFTPNAAAGSTTTTFVLSAFDGATTSDNYDTTVTSTAPINAKVTIGLAIDSGASSTDGISKYPSLVGSAGAGALITLSEGANVLGTTTASLAGAWSFTPTLPDGVHTITATEATTGGRSATASLTFTLDTTPPAVTEALVADTGISSTDLVTSNPALTGQGDPNAVVTVTEGSARLGTATANATGMWQFTPTGLPQGSNTITASETDLAGNTGTAALTFILETVPPTVTSVTASPSTAVLGTGQTAILTLNMSSAVTVSGTPVLTLDDGGTATYVSGAAGSSLNFLYTVAAGQDTPDLTVTGVTGGATIADFAGNTANLAAAVANPAGTLAVDTYAITSLTDSAPSNDVNAGKKVTITLHTNAPATVKGGPILSLNDGGSANYLSGSGGTSLVFSTTIKAGQNAAALAVTAVNLPSKAAITGPTGLAFNLAGAIATLPGPVQVDTTAPTIVAATSNPGSGNVVTGAVVTLTEHFSESVKLAGTGFPTLKLNDGGSASYTSGTGTAALNFAYTVLSGQTTTALEPTALSVPRGTTITDLAGNSAVLSGASTPLSGSVSVNTQAAALLQVSSNATDLFAYLAADPMFTVDLLGGIGGYGDAASVMAALTPDGAGGTMLPIGAGHGLDFVGLAPGRLQPGNFQIG